MSLTTRFHVRLPDDSANWKLVNAHEAHAEYRIYEESLSRCSQLKIIGGIVIKSLFTCGMYLIILKYTKDGKLDLENLRKRKWVHYVRNTIPKEDIEIKGMSQKALLKAPEVAKRHEELVQQNKKNEIDRLGTNILLLSDVLKSCMKQAQDFRYICNDIKEVVKKKREFFLDLFTIKILI